MSETLTVRVTRLEELAKKAKWVLSIAGTCLVAFGGFTWFGIPERARQAVHDEAVRQARSAIFTSQSEARAAASRAEDDADAISAIRASLGETIYDLGTFTTSIKSSSRASRNETPIEGKDLCILSTISSDGGATKGCSLSKTDTGWLLTASQKKASVNCSATCFNLQSTGRAKAASSERGEAAQFPG